jgi:hypothetical protein
MAFNTRNGISVGADVSAFRGIHDIPLHVLKFIIAFGGFFSILIDF